MLIILDMLNLFDPRRTDGQEIYAIMEELSWFVTIYHLLYHNCPTTLQAPSHPNIVTRGNM